jgi:glutamate-1-semialdehyde 2,1-aminomutase
VKRRDHHTEPLATPTSAEWFARATRVIPGGVNSPVRAFRAVGGEPVFVCRAHGSQLVTADGRILTDFCGSWGPLILGHARQEVVEAVAAAAADGTSFGISTPREVEFAELLCRLVPSIEMVRLVSSGTEAVMTALRLARGYTGRPRIVKFDGCYHGHSDAMLVSAGSGVLTGGLASSDGVPPGIVADVFVAPYNDLDGIQELFRKHGDQIAAVIVEPVAGNMGLVKPADGFLAGLRAVTQRSGSLLIFDEVITGFRFGPTTYGHLCGVSPDLVCLGKIIGGGMPIGAVGGSAAILNRLAPTGPVYQAGTLSGNPVAVAAGKATLEILERENPYQALAENGIRISRGLSDGAVRAGVPLQAPCLGGVFTPFFTARAVGNLADAKTCDTSAYAAFFRGMLRRGFYLSPSQFEVGFVSSAHSEDDVNRFVKAAGEALADVAVHRVKTTPSPS